jgi:enoyl-CoA hydratase/carnithine racemase
MTTEERVVGELVTWRDGAVVVIEMNDPEHLNPLEPKTVEADMTALLRELDADLGVRVAVLTGRGRAFSAGAYIGPPKAPRDQRDVERTMADRLAWGYSFGDFWKTIHGFKKPIVAAVRGYALGGGWKLAFMCDMIIAGQSAVFGSAEMKMGLMPSPMTAQYLPKMLGKHRAFETFALSKWLKADEALALGLVNRVVSDEECLDEAMTVARQLSELPAVALAFTKQAMVRAMALDDGYDLDRVMSSYLRTVDETQAASEAMRGRRR